LPVAWWIELTITGARDTAISAQSLELYRHLTPAMSARYSSFLEGMSMNRITAGEVA
jgi:hypothetical protein